MNRARLNCPPSAPQLTRRRAGVGLAALAAMMWLTVAASAQSLTGGAFKVTGAVASGGGTSRAGAFSVNGWAASAGAGVSTGGAYGLTCGLLGLYGWADSDVAMNIEHTASGAVRIWWPPETAGYVLEASVDLGAGLRWEPVAPAPPGNSYTVEPVNAARFYRLRQL